MRRDHPRSRGVYITVNLAGSVTEGSSPLARGLLATASGKSDKARIIPARAGFTYFGVAVRTGGTDHPRSRGVYFCLD